MSLLDWIKPFNKVVDVVAEVVEDKDQRNRINAEIETLRQQVYMAELNAKTIPWVDALHKMQRGILSVFSMGIGAYLVHKGADAGSIAAIVGPAGIYNFVKGKGT